MSFNKFLTLALIATLSFSLVLAQGPPDYRVNCDITSPEFQDEHSIVVGALAQNSEQGYGWWQDSRTIAPVSLVEGTEPIYIEVQRSTWFQHVIWDPVMCMLREIQFYARYNTATHQFLGWAIQETGIENYPPGYMFNFATHPPTMNKTLSQYGPSWLSPYLYDSAVMMGTSPYEAALGPSTMGHSWLDSETQSPRFFGRIQNYIDNQFRMYSYVIPIQAIPGDVNSFFEVHVAIESRVDAFPQVILDALDWYMSVKDLENPPLVTDPHDPYQQMQIFMYTPTEAAKRSDARNVRMPPSHGHPVKITDYDTYTAAVDHFLEEFTH